MTRTKTGQLALMRSALLCIALAAAVSGFLILTGSEPAFASAKAGLNKTQISMETGTAAKLRVMNARRNVRWTSGDRQIVTIRKHTGKYRQSVILVAGTKAGTCVVKAKVGHRVLKCRVTVTAAASPQDPDTLPDDPQNREIEILDLSPETVDRAAGLQLLTPVNTDSSADFDLAFTDFSLRLLQTTLRADAAKSATSAAGNVLISPDSMMTALTMAENGAAGNTRTEMQQTLAGAAPDLTCSDLNEYLLRLHTRLTGSNDLIYTSSNSIWARKNCIAVNPAFLQCNKAYHNASFYEAAFDKQTCIDMNSWVYNNTRNMIRQIIDPQQGLEDDMQMVLINAIAFEGKWEQQFLPEQIMPDQVFTLANGTKKKVTMLSGIENTCLEMAGGTGFVKNYLGGDIAFLGLLPPKGVDAAAFAQTLTGRDFTEAWQNRTFREVDIRLPKFRYDYTRSMVTVLQSMGMKLPFLSAGADFSGMLDPARPDLYQSLYISDVLHKTHIELDENGTKAAAVTAIFDRNGIVLPDPPMKVEVFLDRPFLYGLIDTQTGNPLFLGVVEDPVY